MDNLDFSRKAAKSQRQNWLGLMGFATLRLCERLKIYHLHGLMGLFSSVIILSSCNSEGKKATPVELRDQPNIVFILADDLGWNEVGFNGGNPELTPNIDQLRKEGLSLTQFYVHAVCAPSRSAFLTGRYPFRNWSDWRTEDFGKPSYLKALGMELTQNADGEDTRRIHALPTEERTIAEALKEAGYFTALSGKWGCGEWLPEHLPMGQGFDHQYGHYAWGIDYNNYTIPHNAPARFAVYDWHRNQEPIHEQGYSTDLIANEVVRLLSEQKEKHGEKPFFYYVPFNAVHGPLEEIPRYTDTYEKRYAALKCLDDGVGRILGALEQYGFSENTLVVFTNDNGAIRPNMNAPYRGTKNTNYEGGVRVPCILKWPGKIGKNSSHNGMMHIVDFYNTLISFGGGKQEQPLQPDGIDMSALILNGAESSREEIIFEVSGSVRWPSMRMGDYKLNGEELYHLIDDPSETKNIAEGNPEIVAQMKKRLEEAGNERPPMPAFDLVMTPALPWVYGQQENANTPEWLKVIMREVRSKQPQEWAEGTTPWPQAPKDGKIIYTGDGR